MEEVVVGVETRACPECGLELPIEEFMLNTRSRKTRSTCAGCLLTARVVAAGGIGRGSVWWLPCSYCGETFKRVSWNASRATTNVYCSSRCSNRSSQLRYKYGLEPSDFRAMWIEQAGLCAMPGCFAILGLFGGHHVDHDHETGRVRGLLCAKCNTMLGWFERAAAVGADLYLERV